MPDEPKVVNFSEKEEPIKLHLKPFEYKAAAQPHSPDIQKKDKKVSKIYGEKHEEVVGKKEEKPAQEPLLPKKPNGAIPEETKRTEESSKGEVPYSLPAEKPKPLFVLGLGGVKLKSKQFKIIFLAIGLLLAAGGALVFYGRNKSTTGDLIQQETQKPQTALNASVKFGEVFLTLQNLDSYDWTVCRFSLLGVNTGKIYYFMISEIRKGRSQTFNYAEFYTDSGEKMDPLKEKNLKAKMVCDLENSIGIWTSDGDF